jgi:beta-N-acetylhexosaminidase
MRIAPRVRAFGPVPALLLAASALLGPACRTAAPKPALSFGPREVGWVERTLGRMTVEEKVGQLIGVRSPGRFFNREDPALRALEELVVERHVGTLVLFGGNVYETAFLTNALQSLARVPLLVSADFERGAGGQVEGATAFPPLMALGAIGSEETAYAMGRTTALEGRAMGVHITFAPVLDVNVNPDNPIINTRSVGESPEEVGRIGKAFIRGCQDNGMLATAKHFPGHGDTSLDSHLVLPSVAADARRLERVELSPFRQAIAAGVQAIMIAHLDVPALDPEPNTPATLSRAIVTDLLRTRMGFRGLVVSDAMEMGGITKTYGAGEAAVRAVQAGIDIVLLPADTAEAIDALLKAVGSGVIPMPRLDESVRRVLRAKARVGLSRNKLVRPGDLAELVAARESVALAAEAFERSLTLVKNDGPVLPLTPGGGKVAVLSLSSDAGDYYAGRTFVQEMAKRVKPSGNLTAFTGDLFTGQEYLDGALAYAKGADTAVIALFSRVTSSKGSVALLPRHVQAVRELVAAGVKVVVVSFGSPYLLSGFPEVQGYVCAYRPTSEAQSAAVKALFGEIDVGGRLPVSLPGLYPCGHGLVLKRTGQPTEPD